MHWNASAHYKCILQVIFGLCYSVKWSGQYVCFHFMYFAWWFVCFQSACASVALGTTFVHKHFSPMHLCNTRVTCSFLQDLTSKSDSKHDTVWLDVNGFSGIVSKVWAYPMHFTTNNKTLNNSLQWEFFYLFIFFSPTMSALTALCPAPQNHRHLHNLDYKLSKNWSLCLMHKFGCFTGGKLIFCHPHSTVFFSLE